jgi:segregation and condensation protein B
VAAVEAILFAAGEPVHPKEIGNALGGRSEDDVAAAIAGLDRRYAESACGLFVERVAGAYRLATKSEVGALVRQFFRQRNRTRLSPAALETLAIVAYKQPITSPEIQAIRGVDPGGALNTLLERKLLRILGRKKVVGNPLLYGTSKHFLVHFGLNRLEDLPSIDDFGQFLGALESGEAPLFGSPAAAGDAPVEVESPSSSDAEAGFDPADVGEEDDA